MLLNKHDLKYKRFLKLQERVDELWKEIQKVPLVKLKEPYQRGWIVSYELKPEIKRRKDVMVLQHIVDLTYQSYYTRKVQWVKVIRSGQKKVQIAKGKWHDLVPKRSGVDVKVYNKLTPQIQKYFDLDTLSELYKKYGHKRYYAYIPQHWMILKARPNIVTHERIIGGAVQKEHDRLEQELRAYWRIMPGNYSVEYAKNHERTKQRALIQKFKHGEIDDIPATKGRMVYND